MANLSVKLQAAARKAANEAPLRKKYKITDPHHRPDMRGELGGVKVLREGTDQIVVMTEAQAKFYIDTGALVPVI